MVKGWCDDFFLLTCGEDRGVIWPVFAMLDAIRFFWVVPRACDFVSATSAVLSWKYCHMCTQAIAKGFPLFPRLFAVLYTAWHFGGDCETFFETFFFCKILLAPSKSWNTASGVGWRVALPSRCIQCATISWSSFLMRKRVQSRSTSGKIFAVIFTPWALKRDDLYLYRCREKRALVDHGFVEDIIYKQHLFNLVKKNRCL